MKKFSTLLVMKAIILAGGFGKRLRPLTDDKPKPMVEVLGVPILEWELRWLASFGIKEVTICVGYHKESILNYIGSGQAFGLSVIYSVEDVPLGTGGAIKNARASLSGDCFLTMNGDTITDIDPWRLVKDLTPGVMGSIAAINLPSPYGIIELDGDYAKGFREKPTLTDYWINAGVYCLSSKIIEELPDNGSIEEITFPRLAKEGKIKVTKYSNVNWRSIDNHKDIEEAGKQFEHLAPSRVQRGQQVKTPPTLTP